MALRLAYGLYKRQNGQDGLGGTTYFGDDDDDGYDGDDYGWWWSPTGMAIRYTIALVILILILLYFIGGYLHARRRVARGLAPLPYHAWMVRRFYRHQQPARYQHAGAPAPVPESYDMQQYPPPPPAYNHNEAPPPVYQPPEGATKAMADQNFRQTYRPGEGGESSEAVIPPAATRS